MENAYIPPDIDAVPHNTTYEYSLSQQLKRVVLPDGREIAYTYDGDRRVREVNPSDALPRLYDYSTTTGQLTQIRDGSGGVLDYSYQGSLLSSVRSSGVVNGEVQFSYNPDQTVASRTVIAGGQSHTVTLGYDQDRLLTRVGDLTIDRNPLNGLVMGTTLGNVVDSYTHNQFGEVQTYQASALGAVLFAQSFERDKLGRIITKTETVEGVTTVTEFSYWPAGWLRTVIENGVLVRSYEYDQNGNRTSKWSLAEGLVTADYDDQDRMIRYGDFVYTYTPNGETETKTNARTSEVTRYFWDGFGNLVGVTLPDGRQIDYVIDGRNRRVGKLVNGVMVQGFIYENQLRVAAEFDGTGSVVMAFVYSASANSPDFMIGSGGVHRIVKDQGGSPRLTINVMSGAAVSQGVFDENGQAMVEHPPSTQPFAHGGGLWDHDTTVVHLGAREFDPTSGRWLSKDPSRFKGGANLFAYSFSDPVNYGDTSGTNPVFAALVGLLGMHLAVTVIQQFTGSALIVFLTWLESRVGSRGAPESLNIDKYYHFVANCRAAAYGRVPGATAAEMVCDWKERQDLETGKNNPRQSAEDQAANAAGRAAARQVTATLSCEDLGLIYWMGLP